MDAAPPVPAAQVTLRWKDQVVALRVVPVAEHCTLSGIVAAAFGDEGPLGELDGPLALSVDQPRRITAGDLVVEIEGIAPQTDGWRRRLVGVLTGSFPYVAASALAHVALLAFVAYSVPALAAVGGHDPGPDEPPRWLHHVDALGQPELDGGPARIDWVARSGGTGERAAGRQGEMGDPRAAPNSHSGSNRWRGRDSLPQVPVRAEGRDTDTGAGFGMAGLLLGRDGVGGTEPSAVWGAPGGQGNSLAAANGNLWGGGIGSSAGAGGLGLSGVGEGGGGMGRGIGLGRIGTIGRGAGTGRGAGLGHGHRARPPRVRCGAMEETATELAAAMAIAERDGAEMSCIEWSAEEPGKCARWRIQPGCPTSVSGRLPPEVVQAVLRRNHGRFRLCYERGLQDNPALQGRVVTRFTIRRDGTVGRASATGDLPDPAAKACMARALGTITFPEPSGGVVNVVYPLVLTPSD